MLYLRLDFGTYGMLPPISLSRRHLHYVLGQCQTHFSQDARLRLLTDILGLPILPPLAEQPTKII